MILPIPARRSDPELLDLPGSRPDLPANLREIRRLNLLTRGTALVLQHVEEAIGGRETASLLDVATGSADIPLAAVQRARKHGTTLFATGLDLQPEVLEEAERLVGQGRVRLVAGDARSLPFPADSFDMATCSLALHHFDEGDAQRVLAEMWRVAHTVIVVDLERSYPGYAGTWLASRVLASNRMTRHDGPLSVLKAFTAAELRDAAAGAGLQNVRVRRQIPFRLVLTARHAAE